MDFIADVGGIVLWFVLLDVCGLVGLGVDMFVDFDLVKVCFLVCVVCFLLCFWI